MEKLLNPVQPSMNVNSVIFRCTQETQEQVLSVLCKQYLDKTLDQDLDHIKDTENNLPSPPQTSSHTN